MTEASIINILTHWLDHRQYPFKLCNSFIYHWECDYWAMTNEGITREFEIKISHSDYLADAKKAKHVDTALGANYFYYVCPVGVIKPEEVNAKYGLIYIHSEHHMELIKRPRKLHANVFNNWQALATKMYWKFYSLWHAKYIGKEITWEEYKAGFNTSLLKEDLAQC